MIMKLFTSLMPLIPQPYKNIIKFFIKVLGNVDSKEALVRIGKQFEDITKDEKQTAKTKNLIKLIRSWERKETTAKTYIRKYRLKLKRLRPAMGLEDLII